MPKYSAGFHIPILMLTAKGKEARHVIAIAHRLDSIKSFDDILVIQDGCIVEHGKFGELMEKRQHFHKLYNEAIIGVK